MKEILVIVEFNKQDITDLTKEILGVGKDYAQKRHATLSAVILGERYCHLVDVISSFGADCVYVGKHKEFNNYNSELYLSTLDNLIKKHRPELVLCGMTANGRDIGTRLAARLRTVFLSGCTSISINAHEELEVTRLRYEGFGQELVTIKKPTTIILGIPPEIKGIEEPVVRKQQTTELIDLVFPPRLKVRHINSYVANPGDIDLPEADVVIAGGNGMGDQETFDLLQEVGGLIGAPVGGSRVALDKGWIPTKRMIGVTGKVIRSRVYLALGISGAVQHLMGIKGCKALIAVNKNPRAEIMQVADMAVIGDIKEILPALIEQLQDYRPKAEVGLVDNETKNEI